MKLIIQFAVLVMIGILVACNGQPTEEECKDELVRVHGADDLIVERNIACPEIPEITSVQHSFIPPPPANPPSIDAQILHSDTIVVASLQSVTATTKIEGEVFLPAHRLTFNSIQYLKGNGPSTFVVEVVSESLKYDTASDALAEATRQAGERNAEYDNRQGVLFLQSDVNSGGSGSQVRSDTASVYSFIPNDMAKAPWEYSVNDQGRVWLPASQSDTSKSTRNSISTASTEYIHDTSVSPNGSITLADLQSKIAAITNRLASGASITGFKECVAAEFEHERYFRHKETMIWESTLSSGANPTTQPINDAGFSGVGLTYISGTTALKDAEHFEVVVVDDDENPQTHRVVYRPTRPLPKGQYTVRFDKRFPVEQSCNADVPSIAHDLVTVEDPAGTLHEAFFDPVTVGSAVKADSSNGVLKPMSFTVGGTATEITGLEWSNNKVVLTLNPHVSLGGAVLSFIELDGSVSLSLSASDATVDSAAGIYSWPVTTQPWENGDQLMLRIRKPAGVYVALSPKADIFATRTDITVEWIDSATCADDYFVAVYNNEELYSVLLDLGRHSNQASSTGIKTFPGTWAGLPTHSYFNGWVGVICTTTGWRVVGKASVQSGMPNNPATGAPTISGTPQEEETLTASTSGIADADGLTNVSYNYQWLADDANIAGATSSTYVLTNDEVGKTIKVRVTFTDDKDHGETLTSIATMAVAARPNNDATGAPTISGTPREEETQTASTSAIEDEDGLTNVSYSYQWLADDADISEATGSTYVLTNDEVGKTIKVRVTFTDDKDHGESLTSIATVAVAARPNNDATGAPTISGTPREEETLTASTSAIADADGLTNVSYNYQWLAADADISEATGSTYVLTNDEVGKTIKVKVTFTDDADNEETLTSAATTTVAAKPNNAATGAPTISGAPQAGETLTASTSAIADADGLDSVSYSYQWLADDADISGATSSTYTLTASEQGKTIKVRVTFTDGADSEETLTSAGTFAVVASNPIRRLVWKSNITIADVTFLGEMFGYDSSFGRGQLSPADFTESGTYYTVPSLVSLFPIFTNFARVSLGVSPSPSTRQIAAWRLVLHDTELALSDATMTARATDPPGVYFEWDIAALTISDRDLWGAGDEFILSLQEAINVASTGSISVSGTPQVDETLTAGTSEITDANGLSNVSYSYQWLADDADISGATSSTYVLTNDEVGKTIKVQVTFTDDDGFSESVDSVATTAVAAKPNNDATGAPTISGTPQVEETLTASTSNITDADGLDNVSYSYQWLADDADISGATSSTYTLTASEQGKTIKVRVTFTDDADNKETLTSAATTAVAAKPNNDATGAPTISGTPQVEETLTASTSTIEDEDGLDNVNYSYQWLADDANIAGATSSTYTLTASEQGKTIKVRVTFTDDADNKETLTSAATTAVAASPDSSDDDLPGDSSTTGEVTVGDTATGEINAEGDIDWFRVSLLASETYHIDMRGKWGGEWALVDGEVVFVSPGTLNDPKLNGIYGSDSVLIPGSDAEVSGNDRGDSSEGLNSRISSFSPSADGVYYIAAASEAAWTGTYQITVTVVADG